jgi:FkbM family methyltransferase
MNLLIQASQWFNYHCPWHQLKPSLAKRMSRRLDKSRGPMIYDRIQGNLRMRLDLSVDFERDIYLNASNMQTISVFRQLLRPGDTVVDGGANLGFLSLVAWQCVGSHGKVYAFEPQPGALELLTENIRLNHADNIIVVPKALLHEKGTAKLFEFAEADHDLPSLGRRADKQISRELNVETVRMDDVIHQTIRLYKLDIEGAEWPAMRGSKRILFGDPPPHVIIELNPRTCEPFGHEPIDVVDWFLRYAPNRRMHLIRSRKRYRVDRADLARLFERKRNKSHNVWFEPV